MPGLGDLFGRGSIAEQMFVWGVLNNVIQAAGSPYFAELTYAINERLPVAELSPADLALMVVRDVRGRDQAAAEAKRSGINGQRFDELVAITGDAPAPVELAVGLRRGLIDEHGTGPNSTSYDQGIREGRLKNKWIDLMRQLAVQWPTPGDALDAVLQGQVSAEQGRSLYAKFGGAPEYFELLFDTRGNAPTPVEAATMANRGIIPWEGTGPAATSFQQAFLEGPWRNKWEASFRRLAEYLPPPRTVTALLRAGSLNAAEATTLLRRQGLAPELAAAYVADASRAKPSAAKELTEAQIVALYESHVLTHDEARTALGKLGLPAHDSDLLLAGAGVRVQTTQINSAITRVRSSLLARHIDTAAAKTALAELGVSAPAAANMLRAWGIELTATPRVLSDAQVVAAWSYEIIDTGEAISRLAADGYSRHDAWILLSIRHKGKLPQEPAR